MSLLNIDASTYVLTTSREYSIYSCESRAIPKVTDGLKDAQRKALWLLRSRAEKTKTISLAGEMISSGLYLHGDQSAAGAISLMAAPFCNNVPLLEGIGTFGTRVAPVDGIGAPRYTYVKRSKASDALMLRDLDIVPLKDNYDGSTKEPEFFLPLIPTVLLNGVSGIAVGWSTEILPRGLSELIEATVAALDGKKVKVLAPKYEYLSVDVKNIEGNTWEISGRVEILDTSTIRVKELPPDLSLEKFKERLNTMEDEDKITSYTDRSTSTINIEVKFKRGSIKDWTETKALDFFKLKQKKSERIVVIDWNGKAIRQYESAEQLVKDFVAWRLGWYTKRYEKMLADDEYELRYWKGLEACFKGKLPEKLLTYKNKAELDAAVRELTSKIGLDDKQVESIVGISTFRWAKDYLEVVKARIKELQESIKGFKANLADPDALKAIYREELMELKKLKLR